MKTKLLFYLISLKLLISCSGGSPLPPFEYSENTRIIIEGVLINEDGSPLSGQVIELKFKRYEFETVKKINSEKDGKFFISVPKSNYEYSLFFEDKRIISIQKTGGILTSDIENPPLFYGNINMLISNYYNFKNIKLKSL
jgi:hypothetical protein